MKNFKCNHFQPFSLPVIPENFGAIAEKFIWNLELRIMSLFSKLYHVHIMASKKNGVLYIGVTSNLQKRIWEHKNNIVKGFTQKYFIHRLIYYKQTENVYSAFAREKQLKKWNRSWKIELIEKNNPDWKDSYNTL